VSNGTVTTLKAGTANITVITEDGNKTATCVLTVTPIVIPVTHVTLNKTIDTLNVGNTLTLTATVFPENATNKNITWLSSDTAIAKVNNGIVTAVAKGTAIITVTTQDGNKTATCNVTAVIPIIPVIDVTLNETNAIIPTHLSNILTLTATVLPTNATNKNVTWSSSDTTVAKVNNGVVTQTHGGAGNVTITVTTEDGNKTATCAVTLTLNGCNINTPGWGLSLGTVSFATTQEWTVSGFGITQIWSDVVQAASCNKTSFNGGNGWNYNADCRSNPDYKGDLFSFCAVVRFKETLCPDGWRVPTMQDFIDLDIALGGSGINRHDTSYIPFIHDNYLNPDVWGGAFGGVASSDNLYYQGTQGFYFSQTDTGVQSARSLLLLSGGGIRPQYGNSKLYGYAVRCVR
jgi:uncharacterized protein YjdB